MAASGHKKGPGIAAGAKARQYDLRMAKDAGRTPDGGRAPAYENQSR
jgi:hypothetical protein